MLLLLRPSPQWPFAEIFMMLFRPKNSTPRRVHLPFLRKLVRRNRIRIEGRNDGICKIPFSSWCSRFISLRLQSQAAAGDEINDHDPHPSMAYTDIRTIKKADREIQSTSAKSWTYCSAAAGYRAILRAASSFASVTFHRRFDLNKLLCSRGSATLPSRALLPSSVS